MSIAICDVSAFCDLLRGFKDLVVVEFVRFAVVVYMLNFCITLFLHFCFRTMVG